VSGMYEGDGRQTAIVAMERIYGFLVAKDGDRLMTEWQTAREGLATVAEYHQVVSRLTSLACQLVDEGPGPRRTSMAGELAKLVEKLQNVSPLP
jgi:hypothetical protein